ncbi:methyl-coenzyme M reductase operon protein D [Methanofollis formosanus]|uniref:Methyl-coenzyme M reductase operon protein D n=1 Tax=Methanofollis formosanus TaxID=299308 RepID=A0A8G1EFS6_9EURY|nr:methyl-coenzyme M reductase operon protein D [Methanofollis formosanus]QYZ79050.1 methyl-coenzyme M reductase operon protein D [Methanofollis formosanus]
MTEATYPQCRIVPARFLNPETVESLLTRILEIGGIRRLVLNGPRLPATIPYGPARGKPNPHPMRKVIRVGDQDMELQVHVGTILLELEDRSYIDPIRQACDEVFVNFPYGFSEGTFIKRQATVSDYAKYGPDADELILGMTDPKSRSGPLIIQGTK